MTELPPDVRDRAAQALYSAETGKSWGHASVSSQQRCLDMVDAVAEVLAEQVGCEHLDGPYRKLLGERDVLNARVDELTSVLESKNADLRKLVSQLTRATVRAHNERARVDLLTAALTEIVVIVNHSSLSMSSTTTDLLLRSVNRAVAVLSGAPTAPVPHVCQLPDIATVREPSSFNDRRWDCPVCDARWIAMGRIVGRRSRYEWHQMPVTKTATPTGCRFCGEPESDTVWCCDERMEADGPTESESED